MKTRDNKLNRGKTCVDILFGTEFTPEATGLLFIVLNSTRAISISFTLNRPWIVFFFGSILILTVFIFSLNSHNDA